MSIQTPFGTLKSPAPTDPSAPLPAPAARPTRSIPLEAIIAPPHPSPNSANVLIVDADPISCAKIGAWFSHEGHAVALACTRDMAEAMMHNLVFNLIVCDHTAPNPASRKWIDALVAQAPCPVILITNNPTLDLAIRSANLPVAGYLAKPIDFEALRPLINRALRPAV